MFSRLFAGLTAIFIFSAALAAPEVTAPLPPLPLSLQSILLKAMEGTQTPALAAAVLNDGAITQQAVQGLRRNDGTAPALISDVWLIGSDAKPMTAALVMKLVDRGVLSLETPLGALLPALAEGMHPQYRQVTLKQLLSHRSGLPENVSNEAFFEAFRTDVRSLPSQRLAYIAYALKEAPIAAPDAKFSYSNTGYLIAAAVAEIVTDTPYEMLMRREVFGPLGMSSVGYGPTHDGQPIGHIHGRPVSKAEDSNPLLFAPAGNLHMSLRDWSQFCLDQLAGARGKGALLTASAYAQMQVAVLGGASGLGWGVQDSIAGRKGPVLLHAGSDGNWYALVALFPQTGQGVLVAANAGPDMGGDKAAAAALRSLLPNH